VHKTPLNHIHKQLGAKMVDFAGWEMPVLYSSILEEHRYTRSDCTLFDISHMGRLTITGGQASQLLERTCTRALGEAQVGRSYYSHICNEAGGILDDVIVSRYETHWGVVCNASNREKIVAWLNRYAADYDAQIKDTTFDTAMLAIQGPATLDLADKVLPLPVGDLKRYGFTSGKYVGMAYTVFRSGYTGEDGLEVIMPAGAVAMAWQFMVDGAKNVGAEIKPAGLGARDTLRLEAAMPLYGHELTEEIDSISAGHRWCIDLTKDFIGAKAMRAVDEQGPERTLVGLRLAGKRAARQGQAILDASGRAVGTITSGSFSPTLETPIALGYVEPAVDEPGTALQVDIRGTHAEAQVVPLPFYKREQP
jgi:aminomethyltransferase